MAIKNQEKIKEILERGVERIIEKQALIDKLKTGKKLRIKHGIDPTGKKIHLGRATILWKLKEFEKLGHQIILIIGDFTAQIGDASDKDSMRKLLSEKEVKDNMKGYLEQIGKILDIKKTEIHYNSKWLKKLNLKDIISLSMNFTAQQMIQRRNFKERWEEGKPIGVHELLYPLLQGYDSMEIKADVEIGGYDQLFNLTVGREVQKIFNQKPQEIMVLKMLSGLDGRKMSTSWGNVITILDEPKEMFGKIMSMRDELMPDYFELCTKLTMEKVKQINNELNPRDAKEKLAEEITALYWGTERAEEARVDFNRVFKERKIPSDIQIFCPPKDEKQMFIWDILFRSNMASSKGEAKRLIRYGGVDVVEGDKKTNVKNWREVIDLKDNLVIKVGKRRFVKISTKG